MSNNPLLDLGKPFDTLVKKIADGVGALYEPRRIKNVAKAEAEAEKIKAASDIEITDLHIRAEQRRIKEEARHQKNMEDITAKAGPHLNEDANPDAMDDDWVANLFDKCRIVSDDEMQSLWARVLAGEANTPGTYSKRTVNLLSDLDKSDADLFTQLCGFGWMIGDFVPLVFYVQADIYNRNGINFDTLNHLESIGLIRFTGIGEVAREVPKRFTVSYYDQSLPLEKPEDHTLLFKMGQVLLTKMGQELAPICGSTPVEGFYEYVKEQWKMFLPTVEKK